MPERKINTVVTRTVPVLPKPVRMEMEPPPDFSLVDPVIVFNQQEALYLNEACVAFESVGQDGFDTLQQVQASFPGLSRDDACNYNIYGFTLQGWLNLEMTFIELASYVKKLRSHIRYLEDLMDERQRVIEDRERVLAENLETSSSNVISNKN